MHRDVTRLVRVGQKDLLIASDISSGIGEQPQDVLYAPYPMVGAFATRVAMLEILTAPGRVQAIQYMIGGSYESVVRPVLEGIHRELEKANLQGIPVNGSHESNMAVQCTTVGITVIGESDATESITAKPYAVYLMGRPLVGQEVIDYPQWIVTYEEVQALLDHPSTMAIVPIGSRGIAHELQVIGAMYGEIVESVSIDDALLHHSGGPSTAVLVAVAQEEDIKWKRAFPSAQYIGRTR